MMTAIKRTILALLLSLSWLAQAEAQGAPPTPGPYVLFIHCGPKKAEDNEVKRLALMLAKQGYSVREPEEDRDVEGPGVDYFSDRARVTAEAVAELVNKQLNITDEKAKLKARLQTAKNSPYYLGVWLYPSPD